MRLVSESDGRRSTTIKGQYYGSVSGVQHRTRPRKCPDIPFSRCIQPRHSTLTNEDSAIFVVSLGILHEIETTSTILQIKHSSDRLFTPAWTDTSSWS